MRLLAAIGIAFSTLAAFYGFALFSTVQKPGYLIAAIIFLLLDIWCIKKDHDIKSGAAAYRKMLKREAAARGIQFGRKGKEILKIMMSARHQAGLPLAQNAPCFILKENDCFRVSGGGNEFVLKNEKITDICVKKDVAVHTQSYKSLGGAVTGAIFFGPVGAMIGGRTKKSEIRNVKNCLVFTYISEEEISYISFEISAGVLGQAYEWQREFGNKAVGRRGDIVEI